MVSPKNTVGKIKAAEAPYKKKSYHSILVPAKEVSATFFHICCCVICLTHNTSLYGNIFTKSIVTILLIAYMPLLSSLLKPRAKLNRIIQSLRSIETASRTLKDSISLVANMIEVF